MKLWAVLKEAYVRSLCIVFSLLQALPYEDRITHSQSWLFAPPIQTSPPLQRLTLEAPLQLMLSIHNEASRLQISTQLERFSRAERVLPAKYQMRILVFHQISFTGCHYMNTSHCTLCLFCDTQTVCSWQYVICTFLLW